MLKNTAARPAGWLPPSTSRPVRLQEAVERLRRNDPTLTEVDLRFRGIGAHGAKELAHALRQNTFLQKLYLTKNDIGDEGARELAYALKDPGSDLKFLDLRSNNIRAEGARELAELLREPGSALEELDLWINGIGDEGAEELADALLQNSTLEELGLGWNKISDGVMARVEAAMADPCRPRGLMEQLGAAATSKIEDVPYHELKLEQQPLGSGSFKTVHRALWRGQEVAALVLKHGAPDTEAEVFERLGQHPRLTRLLGKSVDHQGRIVHVAEYAGLGSLDVVVEGLEQQGTAPDEAVLLQVALQVCEGMEKVVESGLIHRDLALRNVLVFGLEAQDPKQVRVKVADYGLTKSGTTYYSCEDQVPVRWMPPEALLRRKWSEKSDVWSFGVLLWELWSAAVVPYAFIGGEEVARRVCDGQRLPQPEGCPDSVYALMQRCWGATPDLRPTFKEVRAELRGLFRHRSQRRGSCVVCCEAAATMVLMPCGHQSTCASHTEGLTVCPLCGTPVESAVRVFHA